MNQLKLSFIIPIYNGANFIGKCLDSILLQNIPHTDYEIICVNDCSHDNSVLVVNSYQKKHSNIRLIQQDANLKTGTTCNTGVDNAQGKYIWLIGQDDWIECNCLNNLIQTCDKNELDVLAFNYRRVDQFEKELHSATVFNNTEVMNGNAFVHQYFGNNYVHYLLGYEWRAIFNRKYLQSNNINFKDGAIYEDTTYLFKAIIYAQRFVSIDDFIYNYRVNTFSITDFNKKYKGGLIYEFAFVAGSEVLELSIDLKNKDKEFSNTLYRKAIWYFESFSYKVVASSIKEKRVFYSLLSKNSESVNEMISLTSWYIKLLAKPHLGFLCAIILKPFYRLNKKIKNRNKSKQDWSY